MKKLLGILVLGLMVCSNAYAGSIWNYLYVGMSKSELREFVDGSKSRTYYTNSAEMKPTYGKKGGYLAFSKRSEKFYFPEHKIEILTTHKTKFAKTNPKEVYNNPYYIFENVTQPTNCGLLNCSKVGTGTLIYVVFNRDEAIAIAKDHEYVKRKKAAEEKKKALEDETTTSGDSDDYLKAKEQLQ